MSRPFLMTMIMQTSSVVTEAYMPFTCNASRVTETATNFLHQVDLSAALSNSTFKSLITSRANLLIRDGSSTTLPSKMILDLGNNKLFVYFNGPKSTAANTTFYLHASAAFSESDSTAAFTNSGITNYLPVDSDTSNAASGTVWNNLGTVTYGTGKFNGGAVFNNTPTSSIQAASEVIGVGNVSISLNFNINVGTTRTFIDLLTNGRFYLRYEPVGDGRPENIHIYNDAANPGFFYLDITLGTWNQLTISRNSDGQTTLYVNGVSQTQKWCGNPLAGAINTLISGGGLDTRACVDGSMDDIYFANRLTTDGEAMDRYRVLYEPSTFYTLGSIVPVTEAYMPFTCNASQVTETATNFLHQVDLSAALSNATFKSFVTSRANLLIRDSNSNIMPSKMLLDLTGNTLFVYFDGPKSTSADTTFSLHASAAFNESDSTSAFTNCGITNFWGFDETGGSTAYDYVGSVNIPLNSITLNNPGLFSGSAIADGASDYGISSSNLSYANASTMVIGITIKRLPPLVNERIVFRYGDMATISCLELRFTNVSSYIRVYTPSNYNQLASLQAYGSDGNYHSYVIAYDGSLVNEERVKIYYDGVLQSGTTTGTIVTTMPAQAYPMNIGHNSGWGQPCNYDNLYVKTSTTAGFITDRHRVLFEPATFYTLGSVVLI